MNSIQSNFHICSITVDISKPPVIQKNSINFGFLNSSVLLIVQFPIFNRKSCFTGLRIVFNGVKYELFKLYYFIHTRLL